MALSCIRPRRGTLADWTKENPILAEGEFVMEVPSSGVGTGLTKFKIGDGVKHYNELPYAFDGESASKIIGGSPDVGNVISLKTGNNEEWIAFDPVLEKGEIVYDATNNSFKVGDGIHTFSELSYISAGGMLGAFDYDFGDEDL